MNQDVRKILDTYFRYLAIEYADIRKNQIESKLRNVLLKVLELNAVEEVEIELERELKEALPEKRVKSMTEEYKHGILIASMKCVDRVKRVC